MEVTAYLKSLRMAPRKVRLTTAVIKGMGVSQAKQQLQFMGKRAAHPVSKLLDSAVANAERNFSLAKDNLYVKDVHVDGGTVLKRFKAKGFGSTSPIAKRTSHVRIILDEKIPGLKANAPHETVGKNETERKEEKTVETSATKKKKTTPERESKKGMFHQVRSAGRKFFRRKSI